MDNPSDAELQAALQAYRENIDDHGRAKAMRAALTAALAVRQTHVWLDRAELKWVCDVRAERERGNAARSPAHNARVRLEAASEIWAMYPDETADVTERHSSPDK